MSQPSPAVTWPERPTCHGGMSPVFKFGASVWREPRQRSDPADPYSQPFRTCSYCGSIHPEDLLKFLGEGAKLGGSDWKYGWPHKFYVEGIPNLAAGEKVEQHGYGGTLESWRERYPEATAVEGEDRKFLLHYFDAPAAVHAKWYNEHLNDLEPPAFELVADALYRHAHIKFTMIDGKLKYAAPHSGYQA